MNQNLAKPVPVRLDDREYAELRARVLRRDGWRCQFCGSMTNSKSTTNNFAATRDRTTKTTSLRSATAATRHSTDKIQLYGPIMKILGLSTVDDFSE